MAVAGANFALTYARSFAAARRARAGRGVPPLRGAADARVSLVLFLELAAEDLYAGEEAVRHAVFQTVSIMTTTGFASADFNVWTACSPRRARRR